MQPDEPRNYLRFAAALKILVGSSITLEGLDRAKELLRDYLLGFSEVNFSEVFLVSLVSHNAATAVRRE